MKRRLATFLLMLLAATPAASARAPVPQQPAAQTAEAQEDARLNAEVVRLYNEGKYDEALAPARRVLELRERAHGPEHLLVAFALKNLATIYVEKRNFGEAAKHYQRALDILEKHTPAQASAASDVAVQLGILKFRAEDYAQAEAVLKRAVTLKEQAIGVGGRDVAYPLFVLADAQLVRHGFDRAEPFYDRAMTLLETAPPQKDPVAVRQLKELICRFDVHRAKEASKRVHKLLNRLEYPEKAAEFERQEKERKARGEPDEPEDEGAGDLVKGKAIRKPPPSYPQEARSARVSGRVVVYITVDEEGKVIEAEAVCGPQQLKGVSVEAARKARFTPTLLSGVPVRVTGIIKYNFVLQ